MKTLIIRLTIAATLMLLMLGFAPANWLARWNIHRVHSALAHEDTAITDTASMSELQISKDGDSSQQHRIIRGVVVLGMEDTIWSSGQLTESLIYVPIVALPGYSYLPMVFGAEPTPTPTPTPTPSPDEAEAIFIPAGEFQMGCDGNDPTRGCRPSNRYLHAVYLDAYFIDKNEVTNARYEVCVRAGGCTEPHQRGSSTRGHYYGNLAYANHPVIWVDWHQAVAFCAWAGKRLPTEAEWEKAARGTVDFRRYPWGDNTPTAALVNAAEFVGDTTRTGSYPRGASPYGVMDMAGNTWEWVNDWFGFDYYLYSPYENPPGPSTGQYRVRRGGSWGDTLYRARSDYRSISMPASGDSATGFRCVRPAH